MSTINSVPKIYRMGERFTQGIFDGPVVIEEKYDGSQFTFGVIEDKLVCRSKGAILNGVEPGMFEPAINTAHKLHRRGLLTKGLIYLCEFLAKPKHNVLTYSRAPKGFLVLYDVFRPDMSGWMNPAGKIEMANILDLEPVQVFFTGNLAALRPETSNILDQYVARLSSLGTECASVPVEGIVIKNYGKPHGERGEGWPQTAKIVSERFKEKQALKPRNPKPGSPDEFVQRLVNSLRTEARWQKAVQHLREAGRLGNCNADIGPLCKEAQRDVLEEEADWIKTKLFEEFSKEIAKGVVQGLAQWYQSKLTEGWTVFEEQEMKVAP